MRNVFILFALCFCLPLCAASKDSGKMKHAIKFARTAIKNNKDQQNAEKQILEALKDSDVTNQQRAEAYYHAALLQKSINDGENLKLYLRQAYDTTRFFSTVLQMNRYLLSLDSIDVIPNSKGEIKPIYSKKSKDLRELYRTNLLNGGKHAYQKAKFQDAYQYFDMYLRVFPNENDSIRNLTKYWASVSAYSANEPNNVLVYINDAIETCAPSIQPSLMEYKARSLSAIGDSVEWLVALEKGVASHSQHDYFFTNLVDYYNSHELYVKGFTLADSLSSCYPQRPMYWYAQSLMTLGMKEYEASIALADSAIVRDKLYADAYYIKGICYCNLALNASEVACNDMKDPKCRADRDRIVSLYREAKAPMEMYRSLMPDRKDLWAAPLYRIYLHLNMGKEFDEMDRLLKQD